MLDDDGYEGPATLFVEGEVLDVTVRLSGRFQPLDGLYRWYGRLEPHERVTALLGERGAVVVLKTPEGDAEGRITESDLWHRYRIEGTSVPPFRIPFDLEDVEVQPAE